MRPKFRVGGHHRAGERRNNDKAFVQGLRKQNTEQHTAGGYSKFSLFLMTFLNNPFTNLLEPSCPYFFDSFTHSSQAAESGILSEYII
jgi:hypothetical protein